MLEDEKSKMWAFFEKKYTALKLKGEGADGRQATMARANQFV